MLENPFTPIFGGKPDFFFGRKDILARFDRAQVVRGSEDRTLFITGARGSGKTALVEQLSRRAALNGWDTFDLTAENALQSLFRQVQEYDVVSSTVDPKLEVKVLGSGGSIGGKSTTRTSHYDIDDVDVLFRRACEKAKRGFFVSIDEIQKVPLEDVSCICGAFQMASRKGCDVILVAAGLPFSFERAIQHDGCTYLRRSVHEELGLLEPREVEGALADTFERIGGLSLGEDALSLLTRYSSGHPYMMQLLGYHLVEHLNGRSVSMPYCASVDDVELVAPVALDAYDRRAIRPLMDSLPSSDQAYLRAMAGTMGDDHIASTRMVAEALGKTHQQAAPQRQRLIDRGIIAASSRGHVRFAIPYLRAYLTKAVEEGKASSLLSVWDV